MLEVCYLSISSIRSQSLTEDLPLGKLKKKKKCVHACVLYVVSEPQCCPSCSLDLVFIFESSRS